MEAPRNAPPCGAGIPSEPLENLGVHYYMGNTKIATMFASHGVSRKRRWAALRDWTSWSDGCHLGANSETASRAAERTGPDVHLIKQVEQVTKSALEEPIWRFARIPRMGVTDAGRNLCISVLAITELAVIWLQKQPKHPEEA